MQGQVQKQSVSFSNQGLLSNIVRAGLVQRDEWTLSEAQTPWIGTVKFQDWVVGIDIFSALANVAVLLGLLGNRRWNDRRLEQWASLPSSWKATVLVEFHCWSFKCHGVWTVWSPSCCSQHGDGWNHGPKMSLMMSTKPVFQHWTLYFKTKDKTFKGRVMAGGGGNEPNLTPFIDLFCLDLFLLMSCGLVATWIFTRISMFPNTAVSRPQQKNPRRWKKKLPCQWLFLKIVLFEKENE